MQHKTLTDILNRAGEAQGCDQLQVVVLDLALAIVQLNAELAGKADKTEGTQAALLSYTTKNRSRRR